MNKKAIMLLGILLGAVLSLCLFFISNLKLQAAIESGDVSLTRYIGDLEVSTISAFQDGEKAMLYIDQAAKYSAEKALSELAMSRSAVNELSGCGETDGYPLYQAFNKTTGKVKDCFPGSSSVEEDFLRYFNNNLNDYIRAYYPRQLSLDSYIYSLKPAGSGIEILGIALQDSGFTLQPQQDIDEKTFFKAVQDMANKNTFFWLPGTTPAGPGSENLVSIRSGYVGLCVGACILRKDAAEQLKKAEDIAGAAGYKLHVYESWRTEEYQQQLWDQFGHDANRVCGPDASGSFKKCPHNQGIAVDIQLLNTEMAAANRQKLLGIMCGAGWVNYTQEWWHFEIGTPGYDGARAAGVCSA